MGQILTAKCRCGYTVKSLNFGAGMMNFEDSCSVPALDRSTMEIVSRDLMKPGADAANLSYYTEPEMNDGAAKESPYEHFDRFIQRSGNYCPKCHQFTLGFEMTALYD